MSSTSFCKWGFLKILFLALRQHWVSQHVLLYSLPIQGIILFQKKQFPFPPKFPPPNKCFQVASKQQGEKSCFCKGPAPCLHIKCLRKIFLSPHSLFDCRISDARAFSLCKRGVSLKKKIVCLFFKKEASDCCHCLLFTARFWIALWITWIDVLVICNNIYRTYCYIKREIGGRDVTPLKRV